MMSVLPDLLTSLRLQRDGLVLRERLSTVGTELATGRKADLMEASAGDPRQLYRIEGSLARATATAEQISLARARAEVTQGALGTLATVAEEIGLDLLAAVERGDRVAAERHAAGARTAFGAAVEALNTRFGGRSLLAGAAVDADALAPADQILAEVAAAVAGAPDAATALAAIDVYFNDPAGGFATSAFQGSAIDAPAVDLGDGTRLAYAERANSVEARLLLQGLATIVTGLESGLASSPANQDALFRDGTGDVIASRDAITEVRARLGIAEERIGLAATTTDARIAGLEMARTALIARDPSEAATLFETLETQISAVYTVTARLSGLSLVNFLR